MTFVWVVVMLMSCVGALLALSAFSLESAPVQAATAALALCAAGIPYVFARSLEKLTDPTPQFVRVLDENETPEDFAIRKRVEHHQGLVDAKKASRAAQGPTVTDAGSKPVEKGEGNQPDTYRID